jgi:hypothetical protein
MTTATNSGFGVLKLERKRRVDWPRVLANLQACGMTMEQIAGEVDVGKATLYGYASHDAPSEPAFWVGIRICDLWGRKTGYTMGALPVRKVDPTVSEMLRAMR